MEVGVLGPTQVRVGSDPVDLGTRKQRALVAALALYSGRPVSVDAIIDLLWGNEPPPGVTGTLQAYVSGLRRALEPTRQRRAPAALLVTVGGGYALRVQPDQLDAARFVRAITDSHARLASVSAVVPAPGNRRRMSGDQLERIASDLDNALGLWRGEPYLELDDAADAEAERARLADLQLLGVEDRALARLWLGRSAPVAAELEPLTAAHPLRERLWALRALALTRAGRQAEALEVLGSVRRVLDDELGLEPGAELRALQTAVLRQDPALEWVATDRSDDQVATARRSAGPTTTVPAPQPSARAGTDLASRPAVWPMVGRDEQLAALAAQLAAAEAGTTVFAGLVGDPGIGKTRLAGELAALARSRGVRVLTGRCSQDEGAPPLWPWASVLHDLDRELTSIGAEEEVSQFLVWRRILETVADAARQQTVLLVMDDLHWADPDTLRVLRLLAETGDAGRLLVVLTWRAHPEPSGALADLIEMLGRRHALRLRLEGVSTANAASIVQSVAATRPSKDEADTLRARTDGNPFFLVEYARLAADRGDLHGLLLESHPPTAVQEVLSRRLARLPDAGHALLRTASVFGRQFDLATLAGAADTDEDTVLDRLEPALAAGLVREETIDRFTFAHALVRDTAYTQLPASRRARLHVRVAQLLQNRPGRETELARHWRAAGPTYADRAWRAAVSAAGVARRVHAHEQSAQLLTGALESMAGDPAATALDRYEVLLQLIDAYRWSARWPKLTEAVERAIEAADAIGDPELLARAATSTTMGTLWQSAPTGQVHGPIVAALRRALDRLPTTDGPTRCRVMLSLANELYYGATFAERLALVEEALGMAERLGDRRLLLDANSVAFSALWCPSTALQRLRYATCGMELAAELGEEQAYVVSATLRAVVEGELGHVEQMWTSISRARAAAEQVRLLFGQLVLDTLELPWRAMAGLFGDCADLVDRIARLEEQLTLEPSDDAAGEARAIVALWQGRSAEVAPMLTALEDGPLPMAALALVYEIRGGELDRARAHAERSEIDLSGDTWFSMLNWCAAAEVSAWLGKRNLAADAYARIAPFAGRACTAGSGNALGPVDAFLALAAAAVGERDLATGHADRAAALIEQWRIPLAAQWWSRQRARFGF